MERFFLFCIGVLGAVPLGEGVMDDLLSVLMMGDPRLGSATLTTGRGDDRKVAGM